MNAPRAAGILHINATPSQNNTAATSESSDPQASASGIFPLVDVRGSNYDEKRLTMSEMFCPPKPKLLLRAWWTRFSRAALGM